MIQLQEKMEELIGGCPSNWATIAAKEMKLGVSTVRKIKSGTLGKRDHKRQIELIEVLKQMKKDYQSRILKAIE